MGIRPFAVDMAQATRDDRPDRLARPAGPTRWRTPAGTTLDCLCEALGGSPLLGLTPSKICQRSGKAMVPKVGVEPTHPSGYTILSRARLPVPPLRP